MTSLSTSAGARLRRTFHYPADDDDDDNSDPDAMDEQEQEALIANLTAQNTSQNALYSKLLYSLPILASIPHFFALVKLPSLALRILLGLSSLAATALQLYIFPPTKTGIRPLDAWISSSSKGLNARAKGAAAATASGSVPGIQLSSGTPHMLMTMGHGGPLHNYLPPLNMALSLALALPILTISTTDPLRLEKMYLALLPALVYAIVTAAKFIMASVDPEAELEGLKYQYKGA